VSAVVARAKEFGLIIGELDPQAAAARDARLRSELASGRMETIRQKFIPDLAAGLIAAGAPAAGTLFPQPFVRTDNGAVRLDDRMAPEFAIVAAASAVLDALTPASLAMWTNLHGERVVIRSSGPDRAAPGVRVFDETEHLFADWLTQNGITAAIVRPDRAVYGGARNGEELNALIEALAAQLGHAGAVSDR
jgi:3-(3-hydroxy-phenyl)propionate hydroxylase